MKKLILTLSFLGAFFLGHSQVPQVNKTWWEYQTMMADTFGVKNDTVPLPTSLKNNKWSFLGAKDSILYMWSISKQHYVPVGSGTTTINANWGSIAGTLSSQTDLQTALNAKVPTTRTITINGVTQDLSANRTFGPFLTPADTVWLHNQITTNGTDNLTFSQGLLRAGNTVTALPDNALWNASKIESRSVSAAQPLNGQALVWDSVNTQWKPGTISSGSTYSAGFGLILSSTTFKVDTSLITTNAHLYKVADSLGALIGGGGGTTTNALTIGAELSPTGATSFDGSAAKTIGIQPGSVTNAMLATPYSLPTASTSTLGGVKVDGTSVTINGSGVISASGSTPTLQQVVTTGNSSSLDVYFRNATTAVNGGAQANSPDTYWIGQFWNNTSGASDSIQFRSHVAATQGFNVSNPWKLQARSGTSSWTDVLTAFAGGNVTVSGNLTANSLLFANNSSTIIGGVGNNSLWYAGQVVSNTTSYFTNNAPSFSASANNSYASTLLRSNGVTEASSGTHHIISNTAILPFSISNGSAGTDYAATFYIGGSPTGTATITSGTYSMWVDSGMVRIDDALVLKDAESGTPATITGGISLYSSSGELNVKDAAGNATVLSPHNFTGIPGGRSENMAWAYYSERDGKYVNVDMMRLARLVEKLSGEKLIYIGTKQK